jgi:hypothetical protein
MPAKGEIISFAKTFLPVVTEERFLFFWKSRKAKTGDKK